jgi:hypothetical protein
MEAAFILIVLSCWFTARSPSCGALSTINRLENHAISQVRDAIRVRSIIEVNAAVTCKAREFHDCAFTALGACFAPVTGASGSLVPSSGVFATRLLASRPAT